MGLAWETSLPKLLPSDTFAGFLHDPAKTTGVEQIGRLMRGGVGTKPPVSPAAVQGQRTI